MTQVSPEQLAAGQRAINAAPAQVALGSSVTLHVPADGPVIGWAIVSNASPFVLNVATGSAAGHLAPFTADVYPVGTGGQGITATPVDPGIPITPGQSAQLYASFYSNKPSGTYPAAIGAGQVGFTVNGFLNAPAVSDPSGVVTLGPFPTAGYQGARWSFVNVDLVHPLLVEMQWRLTASSQEVAARRFVVPKAQVIAGTFPGLASFAHPHLGDEVVVRLTSLPFGAALVGAQAIGTHHNSDVATWADYFFTPGQIVLPRLVDTIAANSAEQFAVQQLYAGPAMWSYNALASTAWSAGLRVVDADGSLSYIGFASSTNGSPKFAQVPVILPALPLVLELTNNDGAARAMSAFVSADDWRVG